MSEDYDNPIMGAHGGLIEDPTERPDPDVDEVQQHDPTEGIHFPVKVQGPVETRPLPAVNWRTHHFNIDNTQVVEIAPANPRRSRLIISVRSQVGYIADTKVGCTNADGFPVASPSYVELRHTQPVYFTGGAAGTSEVGVAEEFWTH
jgi:hypothetical protein